MLNIIFILIKLFHEPLCPVNAGRSHPARNHSHQGIKVISQICNDCSRKISPTE